MKQLDLGCGDVMRALPGVTAIYGVDVASKLENVKIADLTFDKIPYDDKTFDYVSAFDFLEHIPAVVWVDKKRYTPLVHIFNEIYRVLKPNGIFHMEGPVITQDSFGMPFQDPTHVSFWTPDTLYYFSGDYFGFHDHYGHTSRFELIDRSVVHGRMVANLRAVHTDGEYRLKYA